MKKRLLSLLLAAGLLCAALPGTAFAALAYANYTGKSAISDQGDGTYTVTVQGLTPQTYQFLMVVRGVADSLDVDSLSGLSQDDIVYLDQGTVGSDGSVTFTVAPQELAETSVCSIFLTGESTTPYYLGTITVTGSGDVTPGVYDITFTSASGGGVTIPTNTDGKLTTLPSVPAQAGYVFAGWVRDNGEQATLDTVFSADTSLSPKWEKVSTGVKGDLPILVPLYYRVLLLSNLLAGRTTPELDTYFSNQLDPSSSSAGSPSVAGVIMSTVQRAAETVAARYTAEYSTAVTADDLIKQAGDFDQIVSQLRGGAELADILEAALLALA